MKVVKTPYSFKDEAGKLREGDSYKLEITTEFGPVQIKLVAKTDVEKKILDSVIAKQDGTSRYSK